MLYWLFGAVLAGARSVRPQPDPRAAVRADAPARAGLGAAQLELGRLLRLHGRALNLYVAFNYSEKIWATFKLFGGMGLMLALRRGAVAVPREVHAGRQAMSVAANDPRAPCGARAAGARPRRRERAAPRPCRLPRRRRHALAPRPSCRRASPAQPVVARHRMVYERARQPHAESHPRARHHGAQPRKRRKESNETTGCTSPSCWPPRRWRSCRCRTKDEPRQEGSREEGCGQVKPAAKGTTHRQGERRRGARARAWSS